MDYLEAIKAYNVREALPSTGKTALLVIDMQRYFEGVARPILKNVLSLLSACRTAEMKIAYTRHGHQDPKVDGGMLARWWGDVIRYGDPEWELIKEFHPRPGEPIFDKTRYSAFHGTNLDAWLNENGIEDLIVTGVLTNCCCETTARDAFVRDYRVLFVADGTATVNEELHLASLKNLAFGFAHVVDVKVLCDWAKSTPHPSRRGI
ncbi:isochorismatase family protein [Desulforhabdus amnigena]|jgi:nicotinamidase-related amidase|uniref:Cysteine hydrolase n=1 Tax=Desulforhabdus amnigena TaxID=40218 RepID=A0A9W6D286_9BACT|nr:isochorismatase family protein [Desulforhabdus amnigena]NLJ27246.1 isochorismatase family protein [Deltaproteobacteria bacterium]GLI32892.1 cysteine hydrolase [Desulforhabdus amnigena]